MKKLFLFALSCFAAWVANAQAVPEFYNSFSSNLVNNYPLNSASNNKAQWIFGPNSFNAGGTGIGAAAYFGNITKIYVKLGSGVSSNNYSNFTIALSQNVGTKDSFGSTSGSAISFTTGMSTMMYQATGFNLAGGVANSWYGINLNGSFPYNPNLSLVVEIKVSGGLGNNFSLFNTTKPRRLYGGYSSAVGTNATGVLNFGFNMIATPLPVQLTSFTGTSLESYDRLNWRTSCELNSSHFNLQYSANGKDFNTISVIPSRAVNGNCQEALEYSTENRDVQNGHNYYRLEQVDLDGHSTFCGEVIDLQRASANSSLSVFPNPCYNQLNITLNSKQNDMVQLYITDMRGEKVWQKSVPVQNGLNTVEAALHPLSSGMYILHAHTRDEQFTRKFEKK